MTSTRAGRSPGWAFGLSAFVRTTVRCGLPFVPTSVGSRGELEFTMGSHIIKANELDSHDSTIRWFSTMYRAKGLEFDQVIIVAQKSSPVGEDADHYQNLVFVTLTSSKVAAALIQF